MGGWIHPPAQIINHGPSGRTASVASGGTLFSTQDNAVSTSMKWNPRKTVGHDFISTVPRVNFCGIIHREQKQTDKRAVSTSRQSRETMEADAVSLFQPQRRSQTNKYTAPANAGMASANLLSIRAKSPSFGQQRQAKHIPRTEDLAVARSRFSCSSNQQHTGGQTQKGQRPRQSTQFQIKRPKSKVAQSQRQTSRTVLPIEPDSSLPEARA